MILFTSRYISIGPTSVASKIESWNEFEYCGIKSISVAFETAKPAPYPSETKSSLKPKSPFIAG